MILEISPFPHFIKNDFLEESYFNKLIENLHLLEWIQGKDSNYIQKISTYESTVDFVLHNETTKICLNYFFSSNFIAQLSNLFNIKLNQCSSMLFHKIETNGYNAIHTDTNDFGELVRLVLYLSNPEDYEGGELVLHCNDLNNSVFRAHKFNANTVFGFDMQSNAHHSVNKVTKGTRFCLVITYS